MGRVSRRKLHEAVEERIFEILWDYVGTLKTRSAVKRFLKTILSETEHLTIAKRLSIAYLLSKRYSYDEIDDMLKVSKSMVSSVERQVRLGAPAYNEAIRLANRTNTSQALWDGLEELILRLSMPARYGSAKHAMKSQIGKELSRNKIKRSV